MPFNRIMSLVGGVFLTVSLLIFTFFSFRSLEGENEITKPTRWFDASIVDSGASVIMSGLFFLILWIVSIVLCVFVIQRNKKIPNILIIFCFTLLLGWLYNMIVWSAPLPTNDSGYYHDIAYKLASNIPIPYDTSTALSALYPHVTFISWFLSKLYILGNSTDYSVVQMFNTFCGAVTAVIIYQLILLSSNGRSVKLAICASITFILFPARLILESFANTESISLLLNLLAIYLLCRLLKKKEFLTSIKNYSYSIVTIGVILAIAQCIRADNLVLLIALAITMVIANANKMKVKKIIYFLGIILGVFCVTTTTIRWGIKHSMEIPIADSSLNYALATGLYIDQDNLLETGKFNSEGWNRQLDAYNQYSQTDINKVNDVAMKQLYKERKEYINEHNLWDELIYYKSLNYFKQYDFAFRIFYEVSNEQRVIDMGFNTDTRKYIRTQNFFKQPDLLKPRGLTYSFQLISTLLLFISFLLAGLHTFRNMKWQLLEFLLILSFVGSWIVYAFFVEVQGRYSYLYFVLLIIAIFSMTSKLEFRK